ncbi:hypothetical protein BJ875DRAFT_526922 [Amylocarpus encephaloides]|uniref:GATA-type domain-containing protein n=1 Tax=Amylocarpus encephaloides TaxID=45428 RepID=A0A9P7Y8H8_9HELO|nr:hypothetical protein BJ875DRAFT_526922 [Amylocarpus encephaloides]
MDLVFCFQGCELDRNLVTTIGTSDINSRLLHEHIRTLSVDSGEEDTEMSEVDDVIDFKGDPTIKEEDHEETPTAAAAPTYYDEDTATTNAHEINHTQISTPGTNMTTHHAITPGRTTGAGLDEVTTPFPEDPQDQIAWRKKHREFAPSFFNLNNRNAALVVGDAAHANLLEQEGNVLMGIVHHFLKVHKQWLHGSEVIQKSWGNASIRSSTAQIGDSGNQLRPRSKYPTLLGVSIDVLVEVEAEQTNWVNGRRIDAFKGIPNDGILHRSSTALLLYRHDEHGIPIQQIRVPLCTEGNDELGVWVPCQSDDTNDANYSRNIKEKKPAGLVRDPIRLPSQSRKTCSRCGFVASLAWRYGEHKSQCQSCGLSREGPHRIDKRAFVRPRNGKGAAGDNGVAHENV